MENIELCIAGELDESKTTHFQAHLKVCDSCRREYEECQKNIEASSEIREVLKYPFEEETLDDFDSLPAEKEEIDGYQLIREIYRGGQGVVYEAYQKATCRRVALKVLLGGPFAGKNAKRRFEREVNLAANLHHPYIVTIHDSGIARDRYYLVMDYIEGLSLDKYISSRPFTFHEKIQLFQKICEAVNFAHQRGVIHRDLKPSNILINELGDPCVLDFGLARNIQDEYASETISIDGQILGTPKYMAPEQTEGRMSQIDARTDVYALGLLFYKMLTGEFPYSMDGSIRQILAAIQDAPPVKPSTYVPQIDRDVEVIVLKTLEKDVDHRYQSVAELLQDIQLWQKGLPIVARSTNSMYVLNKLISRHRFTAIVVGLLLTTILGSLVVCIDLYRTAQAAREKSELARAKMMVSRVDYQNADRAFLFLLFLNAWENGLTKDAEKIARSIGDCREGYGARFLLNPYPLTEKEAELRSKIGASGVAFTEFFLGELHRKERRWMEASANYQKSFFLIPEGTKYPWLKSWMKGRMEYVTSHLHEGEMAKRP
jgi:serine/threonine protein kinase